MERRENLEVMHIYNVIFQELSREMGMVKLWQRTVDKWVR